MGCYLKGYTFKINSNDLRYLDIIENKSLFFSHFHYAFYSFINVTAYRLKNI